MPYVESRDRSVKVVAPGRQSKIDSNIVNNIVISLINNMDLNKN